MTKTKPAEENKIVYPPVQIFEFNSTPEQKKDELPVASILNRPALSADFPTSGGTYVYHEGDKWPVKGWPFKEAVFAANTVKRAILNTIKFVGSSPARYFIGLFFILPKFIQKKIMRSALEQFTEYSNHVYSNWGVYIKPNFMCDCAREISRVGLQMAGLDETSQRLVKSICMILEYDDAYRYRFQDIVGETSKEQLKKNLSKELVRLVEIARIRDEKGTGPKMQHLKEVLPFILRLPGIKETILTFLDHADLNKLKLDEIDSYRCLIWGDYEFGGRSFKDRLEERIRIDKEWIADVESKKK